MVKAHEIELFDALSRNHRFREWVNHKLAEDTKVLINMADIDQLRRTQGRAGVWQTMLTLLDAAPAAAERR